MKNENYDGDDARDCPFCGTPFSANTDTCLGSALDSIASLTARLAASEAALEAERSEMNSLARELVTICGKAIPERDGYSRVELLLALVGSTLTVEYGRAEKAEAALAKCVTLNIVDEIPQDVIASGVAAYRPSDRQIWIRKTAKLPPMIADLLHEFGHHAIMLRVGGDAEQQALDEFEEWKGKSQVVQEGAEQMGITIIVNGQLKKVPNKVISYEEVVTLAFDPVPPDVLFTVTYSMPTQTGGTLIPIPGKTIPVLNGMYFDAVDTSRA